LSGENQNALGGITYPTNVRNTDDPYTKLLFEMSSVIPNTLLEEFIETDLIVEKLLEKRDSRLFLYNAPITSLFYLLRFWQNVYRRRNRDNPKATILTELNQQWYDGPHPSDGWWKCPYDLHGVD
jgi:hypothetical protein